MPSYFGYDLDFININVPTWGIDGIDDYLERIAIATEYMIHKHENLEDITQDIANLILMHTNLFTAIAPDTMGEVLDDFMDNALMQAIDRGEVLKSKGV